MPFTPTRAETHALQRSADRVALRIIRTCRIPRHEQEDLRQDLLTDLFARLKGFDPARGDLGAFAASPSASCAGAPPWPRSRSTTRSLAAKA